MSKRPDGYWEDIDTVNTHFQDIIKNQTMILTGDESHATVVSLMQTYRDIDAPAKYEGMSDDYNLQNCLGQFACYGNMIDFTNAQDVIAGKETAKAQVQFECFDCGNPLSFKITGVNVVIEGEQPCQSNRAYSVQVTFPSGKAIVQDSVPGLRGWEKMNSDIMGEWVSVNNMKGIKTTTERWSNVGVGFFYVGNTCPDLLLGSDGSLMMYPDEENPTNTQVITNICTDLWWATLIDFDNWKQKMIDSNQDWESMLDDLTIVDIDAGTWEFQVTTDIDIDEGIRRIVGTKIK